MRQPRIKRSGQSAVYHCISRIVGGQFLLHAQECKHMRKLIRRQAKFSGVAIINYNVMTNHFHVVVKVPHVKRSLTDKQLLDRVRSYYGKADPHTKLLLDCIRDLGSIPESLRRRYLTRMGDISTYMKELKQRFTIWYNARHERFGTLWAERFKSQLIEGKPGSLLRLCAYLDLNPVRAGMVQDPKDYRFCGYAEAIAGNRLARDGIAHCYHKMEWEQVAEQYRSYMMIQGGKPGRSNKKALDPEAIKKVIAQGGKLSEGELLRLRVRYFTDGLVLGSPEFVEEIFQEFRHRFGAKRKKGAKRLELPGFRDLRVIRGLRKSPYV